MADQLSHPLCSLQHRLNRRAKVSERDGNLLVPVPLVSEPRAVHTDGRITLHAEGIQRLVGMGLTLGHLAIERGVGLDVVDFLDDMTLRVSRLEVTGAVKSAQPFAAGDTASDGLLLRRVRIRLRCLGMAA